MGKVRFIGTMATISKLSQPSLPCAIRRVTFRIRRSVMAHEIKRSRDACSKIGQLQ